MSHITEYETTGVYLEKKDLLIDAITEAAKTREGMLWNATEGNIRVDWPKLVTSYADHIDYKWKGKKYVAEGDNYGTGNAMIELVNDISVNYSVAASKKVMIRLKYMKVQATDQGQAIVLTGRRY